MVVSKEIRTYEFVEDTNFKTIEGKAMCAKGTAEVSGDTCTLLHLDNGQVVMSLSDGMGSGLDAKAESSYIIQLMEALMDSGFGKQAAVRLINSLMFLKSDKQAFSTVDMGMIDLYSGKCEFIKVGAAASYIRRADGSVEEIISKTLPVGAFTEVDYDTVVRRLEDEDMVIMVSDGIVNRFEAEFSDMEAEDTERDVGGLSLPAFIESLDACSPQEAAEQILEMARSGSGSVDDDMTVLTCGIYKNSH